MQRIERDATPTFTAILLAAGFSSRMGQLKALLPWQNTTLINYQIQCLKQAGCETVTVVLGHRPAEVGAALPTDNSVHAVINEHYQVGKTTSIKLGLAHVPKNADAVVLLAVDQPRPIPLVAELLQEFREHRAPITQPTFGGHRGHPIIFRADLLPELTRITEETQGILPIANKYRQEARLIPVDSPIVLLDVNTQADYKEAQSLWPS
ncbi:MAG: nucleotidyltransferase family protein [Dehalococcoidia bacterium]|nr:nucleotidyltransferase family protein [Dehalococcoidia bacterium]